MSDQITVSHLPVKLIFMWELLLDITIYIILPIQPGFDVIFCDMDFTHLQNFNLGNCGCGSIINSAILWHCSFLVVFPTQVFPDPDICCFSYFQLPETRAISTNKPRYFEKSEIAVALKY